MYVGAGLAPLGGVPAGQRALIVTGSTICWTGDPTAAPRVDEVVDLGSAWLTPGFVDAHVHATATGLQADGLDLTGCDSPAQLLAMVRSQAATSEHQVIFGAGWDDLTWPEHRRPSAHDLAAAAPGRVVVLVRIDGHSCLVDAVTLSTLDLATVGHYVHRDDAGQPSGWLLESASEIAQVAMRQALTSRQVSSARAATCQRALDLGITSFHEMGIPALSDRNDALAWARGDWPVTVHAYWAAMAIDPSGVLRPGGDLFLDGSIGSCTAANHQPYRSNEDGLVNGSLFHCDEQVGAFFERATRLGLGAGVHAIGDSAVDQAVRAIEQAAETCGATAVKAARHRIEHAELASPTVIARMARLGVVASVQPAFDAVWNGPGGLYERRFGRQEADRTNPLAWFREAGVDMCFSSDSTVTAMDPWGGVLAAQSHHGGLSLDRSTALDCATLGGNRVIGVDDEVGALTPGRRADFVAWPANPLTADPRGWSPVTVVTHGIRRV
ncbi:MAG: amidohydrolase [Euzebya sp.]